MKSNTELSRRNFIKTSAAAAAGLSISAQSYGNIIGANDRLNVAVIGVNSRGKALIASSSQVDNCELKFICDVDSDAQAKGIKWFKDKSGKKAKGEGDFRRILENKNIDAILIATPDHWHAPMTLMAMQAGKHVYVEKPCSHVPEEGELLIAAQKKYGLVVQMGNQQRSAPTSIEGVNMIREGRIGKPYYGKAWYANTRGSIGNGKRATVPSNLNYDLWQGPAPRMPYMDNLIHYNWHWFWNWGTGEICNNGTHEIDICRWALDVDYPTRVLSAGGRYHFQDDWEFYDTQTAHFEFEGGKTITWEGLSCNGHKTLGRGRGALIKGTEGAIMLDRNGYILYDKGGKVVEEKKEAKRSATTNTFGAGALDSYHMQNFADAIRNGAEQRSHIVEGHKSVLICHLGNIAQKLERSLSTDPKNGHILNDEEAMKMWSRAYEPGWEMEV